MAKAKWVKSLIHWAEQPVRHSSFSPTIQHAESAKRLLIRSIKTNGSGHAAKTRAGERQRLPVQRQTGAAERKITNSLV